VTRFGCPISRSTYRGVDGPTGNVPSGGHDLDEVELPGEALAARDRPR
jgi:hypothetical protein